jgi:hypothetical protein
MSNFITPVAMQVTFEQYTRDLEQLLKELGYKWNSCKTSEKDFLTYDYLNLNYQNLDTGIGGVKKSWIKDGTYLIKEYNPELFLALAAMTDVTDGVPGEYWKCINDKKNGFTYNLLYKANRSLDQWFAFITDAGSKGGYQGFNHSHFVKATKEEIINHFKNKTEILKNIIGYNLLEKGYEKVALKVLDMPNKTVYDPFIIFGAINYYLPKIKELGIMDWFEPVYEEETKTFKVGNFGIVVRDGKAFHKQDNITDFVKGLCERATTGNFGGYTFHIEDITFAATGCQKQQSKLSEWMQVWNAL